MPASLLRSKLYLPPARPGLVVRPRLLERLQASWERRLTLVLAPAGFGKTCLLATWAPASQQPVAWLSLDAGDNDLERFLAYFVAALQTVRPEAGVGVITLLEAARFGPSHLPVETLLSGLVNDLAGDPVDFALVLDDYHVIHDPAIQAAVRFFVESLPPSAHLVISSRADPPWPLARLRVQHQVNELRVSDLRFTETEAAAFLAGFQYGPQQRPERKPPVPGSAGHLLRWHAADQAGPPERCYVHLQGCTPAGHRARRQRDACGRFPQYQDRGYLQGVE